MQASFALTNINLNTTAIEQQQERDEMIETASLSPSPRMYASVIPKAVSTSRTAEENAEEMEIRAKRKKEKKMAKERERATNARLRAKGREERRNKEEFVKVASIVDQVLGEETGSPFFLDKFSIVDCVFIPYVERMNASLFYYKGFNLRDSKLFPNLCRWFSGIEQSFF